MITQLKDSFCVAKKYMTTYRDSVTQITLKCYGTDTLKWTTNYTGEKQLV